VSEYEVVYEQGPDSWSAYVPDLPVCVAAGGTRAEVEQLMREAIEMHVELLRDEGLPVPLPGSGGHVAA
jgi:predicted RNase H-like HicB family nuclease